MALAAMNFLLTKFGESWEPNLVEKVKELKKKLEELNALKEDMESRRRTELRPRKKLKTEVELWFRKVERINGEIQKLYQKFEERVVFTRGFLKTNVCQKIQEVEELFQRGKFHDTLVVDNPEWIGQALSTTTLFGGAAKTCMREIWAYLMDDNIRRIGVWGMGGVGKTTIMKLINNQLLEKTEKFNKVIWVTVSKETNIYKLQNSIAGALHLKEKLGAVEDETNRAGMIYEKLTHKGKYVLILDDLWDKLSLEEVGIPEPSNGSKLLVTTRSLDVCRYLDCREVRVPTLSEPDALELFSEKVGQDVLNHPHLLPIVKSVAKECAGLPLAIVTIATSMKGVLDVHEWRNALHELGKQVKCVNGMEDKVFYQLQFSYDRLQDQKLKHCFLCCALYPEDYNIDVDYELIELWIAEGLVEDSSRQIQFGRGRTILNKLKNSCLIEEGYNNNYVKLHDVVRDMALRITSVKPRFLVRAGMQLNEIPDVQDWKEDLEKISLTHNGRLKIPSEMPPPKCHMLTTLLMSHCFIESIPECFFEQMHGLKILNLSHTNIERLPRSISNLKTLTMLLLRCCDRLKMVPSFSRLQALKKLDLFNTNIKDIPDGMEMLENLKYLDLGFTGIEKMPDGILPKFTSLQHLNTRPMLVRAEEIRGLRTLEFFEGKFHDMNDLNIFAQALQAPIRLCKCQIFMGDQFEDSMDRKENYIGVSDCNICTDGFKIPSIVEELEIVRCTSDFCEEEAFFSRVIIMPLDSFSSLSEIMIFKFEKIRKLFPTKWVQNLQNLKHLGIAVCENMEEIIASESESEEISAFQITLPKLMTLELLDLPELKSICGAKGVLLCDSIKRIEIEDCPELRRIPLNLPLQDDGQPSPPPSLEKIYAYPKVWWESVEMDHPNAKSLLEPYVENKVPGVQNVDEDD